MNTRMYKRRIYRLFFHRFLRFHGARPRRSKEEQAWLDVAPVGREFGSPDYERLQILDLYAEGRVNAEDAMRMLGVDSPKALQQQMLSAKLRTPTAAT